LRGLEWLFDFFEVRPVTDVEADALGSCAERSEGVEDVWTWLVGRTEEDMGRGVLPRSILREYV